MPTKNKIKTVEYNPVCEPSSVHGYRAVRWVENASLGLRLVGFADEIARKEHSRSIAKRAELIDSYGRCNGFVD